MTASYSKDLVQLLEQHQPKSVLVLNSRDGETFAGYQASHPECDITRLGCEDIITRLEALGRYELGIVYDLLEHVDKGTAARVIARLRDLQTERFYVIVPIGDQWQDMASTWQSADMIAYGLSLVASYQQEGKPLQLYEYDINEYKRTPDWLNPKDWANPELWDKYRW